MEGNWENKIPS